MTDAAASQSMGEQIMHALDDYWHDCDDARQMESLRLYGWRGASVPRCHPTRAGEIAAVEAVLSSITCPTDKAAGQEASS